MGCRDNARAMSRDDVEILRALYERWARRDYSDRDAFDPQVVFTRIMSGAVPGPGMAGVWHGVDEMWRAVVDWLRNWEDYRVEPEDFIDLGDRVLVLSRQTARGKLSGANVQAEIGEIFTLRDGRIVSWDLYLDRTEAVQAAGLDRRALDT
jgi:ketosteroid isomerase-like protein